MKTRTRGSKSLDVKKKKITDKMLINFKMRKERGLYFFQLLFIQLFIISIIYLLLLLFLKEDFLNRSVKENPIDLGCFI